MRKDLTVKLLKYFIRQDWKIEHYAMRLSIVAIMNGKIEILRFLFEKGYINDSHDLDGNGGRDLCTMAAASGNLDILSLLHSKLSPHSWNLWIPDILLEAYENNHFNIAKYVRSVTLSSVLSAATCQAFLYGEGMPPV